MRARIKRKLHGVAALGARTQCNLRGFAASGPALDFQEMAGGPKSAPRVHIPIQKSSGFCSGEGGGPSGRPPRGASRPWGRKHSVIHEGSWPWERGRNVIYVGSWPWERGRSVIYEGSLPWERASSVNYEGSWSWERESRVICEGSRPCEREPSVNYEGLWP